MGKLEHKSTLKSPEVLKMNPLNVVEHPPEQIFSLMKLFQRFGFIGSVVVGSGNKILKGHGCTMAAIELGMKKIPVIDISHLTEDEQAAFMISDNKVAELKLYDENRLSEEIQRLMELDFMLPELGLDEIDTDISLPEDPVVPITREHEERKDGEVGPDEDFDTDGDRDKEYEHDEADVPEISEPKEPKDIASRSPRQMKCPNCSHEFSAVKRSSAA